ncbi:MAG: HEAT repeat domain-containing protein [Okeania sp. SIO2D1]|nr:HEAT repeat domain-containing protein [Okeania sp. SIO2D1]
MRRSAGNALGKLGNHSEIVINSLLPLLQDDNFDVRGSAGNALGKLGKKSN